MTHRVIEPEWLDVLPADDPQALASRRDLRWLNFWMGNTSFICAALSELLDLRQPLVLAELGAGDGTFFLSLARNSPTQNACGKIILVDRRPCVSPQTRLDLTGLGWKVEVIEADVFDWLRRCERVDALVANLFLHHFDPGSLQALLNLVSQRCRVFVACEPRRCRAASLFSHGVGLLGCNVVTRHDAPISVLAGFRGNELSNAWPDGRWELREQSSGLFSHLFTAREKPS